MLHFNEIFEYIRIFEYIWVFEYIRIFVPQYEYIHIRIRMKIGRTNIFVFVFGPEKNIRWSLLGNLIWSKKYFFKKDFKNIFCSRTYGKLVNR